MAKWEEKRIFFFLVLATNGKLPLDDLNRCINFSLETFRLISNYTWIIFIAEVEFWTDPGSGDDVDFIVAPELRGNVSSILQQSDVQFEVVLENVQSVIDDHHNEGEYEAEDGEDDSYLDSQIDRELTDSEV